MLKHLLSVMLLGLLALPVAARAGRKVSVAGGQITTSTPASPRGSPISIRRPARAVRSADAR